MSEVDGRNTDPFRPSRSLIVALMARLLVYGGTALAVAIYLIDFRGLLRREASVGQRQEETGLAAGIWTRKGWRPTPS